MNFFSSKLNRRLVAVLLAGTLVHCASAATAPLVPVEALGVRVAPGFRVTLYADSDLADDIYAMTLDARGRVVVTSAGYIKILHDTNGDGRADQVNVFATTRTGGMGMCFEGNDLYFVGDGFFSVYHDNNGDGMADGPPQKLASLNFAEHGGHAMRKGPDGSWYLIGGNDTGFDPAKHATLPSSPVKNPEAGALLRFNANASQSEIVAHGFRNPYDFDFNALGDIFTYDSDVESDFFLPWYTSTRLYHVGYGGHHGWRLPSWKRSWNRPDYYPDTVNVLFPVGRGSPTGVVCYRHKQFPDHYRGGIFALDWTFGKILFFPLAPDGASYRTQGELFLEPIGNHGFAPTDAAVAPDGSLFISIGGRKTRGAVYRIEYTGPVQADTATTSGVPKTSSAQLDAVLDAPQPLDAWSRAIWMPIAEQLGAAKFSEAVVDARVPAELRVRAIEILTERFGGVPSQPATIAARDNSAFVRARVAWAIGRVPCDNCAAILLALASDAQPVVRRCALEAMADLAAQFKPALLTQPLAANLAHPDKRVRQAAARLATLLPEVGWTKYSTNLTRALPLARLTAAMADAQRHPEEELHSSTLETALAVLKTAREPDVRLQAVRLIMLACGDYHLQNPSVEVYTGYEMALSLDGREGMAARIQNVVRPVFGSGNVLLDGEAARLLAMVGDKDSNLVRQVAAKISPSSTATSDFHYLAVLSRLPAERSADTTMRTAGAILGLDRKLSGQQQRTHQNWNLRLSEVVAELLKRDTALAEAMLKHPEFPKASHVGLVALLGEKYRQPAARLFFTTITKTPNFVWSGPLIELLSTLPPAEVRPLLRQQWSNFALRDELLLQLAKKPESIDREKFLTGLSSSQLAVARASLAALHSLPRDPTPNNLVPVLRFLRGLEPLRAEVALRTNTLALINKQAAQKFPTTESETNAVDFKKAYLPILDWFRQQHPDLRRALDSEGEDDDANWNQVLKTVKWSTGNAARGERIFVERGCQTCHAGPKPLGPDLAGAAGRFSAEDLFKAIVYPSREVAELYRTTTFHTRDGQNFTGMISFESADGVILQTGATTTVRLSDQEVVSRQPSRLSLMPAGLLAGLQPQNLADLHAYLKSLRPPSR
ncbi:MAG: HEAT repeat domain-containing protein [Verrucomicrobia bacterium]|nr:HEAT repeat domain-containing protein [Verrucomicrobiota bacterium]